MISKPFFCNLIISSCYPRLSSWGNGRVENNNSSRRCFAFTIVFATTLKSERNEEGQLKNRFSELACSSFKRRQRQQGERTRRSGCLCSITRSNFLRKFWKSKKTQTDGSKHIVLFDTSQQIQFSLMIEDGSKRISCKRKIIIRKQQAKSKTIQKKNKKQTVNGFSNLPSSIVSTSLTL